jgi:lipoprotein-releasing system permease protein
MNPAEKLFLQRYLKNPGRNLLRFSFVFMILGIVLSVGILSAGLNLFEGYERALKSVLLGSFPHISIQSSNREYLDNDSLNRARSVLERQPEISSVSPTISFNLMTSSAGKVHGVLLRAYDQDQPQLARYVTAGDPGIQPGNAIVGHYLASELGLGLGDTLRLSYPQLDRITPLGLFPDEYPLRVSGLYRSGYYEYDRTLVICSIGDAQGILHTSNRYSGIELKLKPAFVDDSAELASKYDLLLDNDLSAFPVANAGLLRVVRMQKWLIFIIFCFLVLIAGINIISAVTAQIYDKKNEIAVLKTLGAAPATIKRILYYQLALVCLISIVLGQLFGLILSWLAVKQNIYHLKGEVYFIDRIQLYVSPFNQLVIFAVAALLAIACLKLPLRRIDRMLIIDLLRNP